ncbi:hypothetical protein Tco_0761897, partial [Tanacetum coccineum]
MNNKHDKENIAFAISLPPLLCGFSFSKELPPFVVQKSGLEKRFLFLKIVQGVAKVWNPGCGPYCQGCDFYGKNLRKNLFIIYVEMNFSKNLQDTSESSYDNYTLFNAPQEPFVAIQKKEEEKRIVEEQAAEDRYWKIPICYDDDEDDTITITPVLPIEEPDNSLSMGDEHLDTIPATESEKQGNKSLSTSTFPNLFLEEANTFDNSSPEAETFCFDLEEISSGSTTTRSDYSLGYDAFYSDDDHIKERIVAVPLLLSDLYHEDFPDYEDSRARSFAFRVSHPQLHFGNSISKFNRLT